VLTGLIKFVVTDGTRLSIFNIMVKVCFFEKYRPYDSVCNQGTFKSCKGTFMGRTESSVTPTSVILAVYIPA